MLSGNVPSIRGGIFSRNTDDVTDLVCVQTPVESLKVTVNITVISESKYSSQSAAISKRPSALVSLPK